MTRSLVLTAAIAAALLAPVVARADVANDPCMGLSAGDACTTLDDKPGTCTAAAGAPLDCVPNGPTGSGGAGGSGGGATATGGTGGSTGTAGGATTGPGGGTTSGGSSGDDGGCSLSHGRADAPAFAGLAAIALGALLARRRRNRLGA